jgi:cellulose biosynthesis protein BcsQ
VLLGRAKLEDALIRDVHPNLDVLPADEASMGTAGRQLADPWVRSRLIDVLDSARADWDITLVDTPGHHSAVVTAALSGSSGAIVPMVPEGLVLLTSVAAAALAPAYAADAVLKIADNAVQVLGGHGYIRDHLVELLLRDARSFGTLDGLAIV